MMNREREIKIGLIIFVICNVIMIAVIIFSIVASVIPGPKIHFDIKINNPLYITSNTAMLSASINTLITDQYAYYFDYGPCVFNSYTKRTNIYYADNKKLVGFVNDILPETQICYRAVICIKPYGISEQAKFMTLKRPDLRTLSVHDITKTSVILRGNITNYGSKYLFYEFAIKNAVNNYVNYFGYNLTSDFGTFTYEYNVTVLGPNNTYYYYITAKEYNNDYMYTSIPWSFMTSN